MDLGYYMDDEQFKELCTMLKFTNGHMHYIDLVQNFEDPRIGEKYRLFCMTFFTYFVLLYTLLYLQVSVLLSNYFIFCQVDSHWS